MCVEYKPCKICVQTQEHTYRERERERERDKHQHPHPHRQPHYAYVRRFEYFIHSYIHAQGPSDMTGCDIYGKAEYENPGGSIKDRAALSIVR